MDGRVAECSHEHADSEADAAQHADAGERRPCGILWHLYYAKLDSEPCEAEHSAELTYYESEEHCKPYAAEKCHEAHPFEVDTCIGKGEERNDVIIDGHLEHVLDILQWADEMVAGTLDALEHRNLAVGKHHGLVAILLRNLRRGEVMQLGTYTLDVELRPLGEVGRDAECEHDSSYGGMYATIEHEVP